ncbi:MAG TPA: DinB family protein [Acidimicrobiales bacterium]|nr:DinB family protein [Acidimicrobiales bacterium]
MAIEPETKDWTWVLERSCPDCGLAAGEVPAEQLGAAVRDNAAAWARLLTRPRELLAARPRDDRWSALEYACHVRDVLRLFDGRMTRMLTEDEPRFTDWDPDRAAVEDRYGEEDPAGVAAAIVAAAAPVADRFDGVRGADWERIGVRSDGVAFSVANYGRYLLHEGVHHLADAEAGLAALGDRRTP